MADGGLGFTPEVERETAGIWEKVRAHVSPLEWQLHAPLIAEINRLKRERDAVILANNYMTPEIFHGVGDYVGDPVEDLGRHVVVGQDDRVLLALQPVDLGDQRSLQAPFHRRDVGADFFPEGGGGRLDLRRERQIDRTVSHVALPLCSK